MLDAHAQAYHIGADARCGKFGIVKLAVGSGGGMGSKRFGIADIHQTQEELQCVDEFCTRFASAFNAETQQTGGFAAVVAVD